MRCYLRLAAFFAVLIVSAVVRAQLPDGLQFHLDASDIDGDGETADNPAPGAIVDSWTDKVSGLVLSQADADHQPIMGTAGGGNPASAVEFADGLPDNPEGEVGDILINTDPAQVALAEFWDDQQGSLVLIASTRNADTQYCYVFEAGGPPVGTSMGFELNDGFAHGLGVQSLDDAPAINAVAVPEEPINDQVIHTSIVTCDGAAWNFFLDGVESQNIIPGAQGNNGDWFGDKPVASREYVNVGARHANIRAPFADSTYVGHIGEILIYDHVLDADEQQAILDYVSTKYDITIADPPPPAPQGLIADIVGQEIFLAWDDVADVDGYNVYRSLTSGGPYDLQNTGGLLATPEYIDSDVVENVSYYYVVTSMRDGQESRDSDQVRGIIGVFTPCDPLSTAGSPDIDGLRFWLDSSDVDADGVADNLAQGTAVSLWRDKICGLELEQTDKAAQPEMDSLGTADAPAVLFGGTDWLIDRSIVDADWLGDTQGSMVAILSTRDAKRQQFYFELAKDNGGCLWFRDEGCAPNESTILPFVDPGSCGFGVQTIGEIVDDTDENVSVCSTTTFLADGTLNYSIWTAGEGLWTWYTNGAGPDKTNSQAGGHPDSWMANVIDPGYVTVGIRSAGSGMPFGTHFLDGHLAEILIYDHPLDITEQEEIVDYVLNKYGQPGDPVPVAPTGLTAQLQDGDVFLDWDDNLDAIDGYNVYRSETQGGPYDVQNTGGLVIASDYLDEDVEANVTYFYIVRAVNDVGQSRDSNETRITVRVFTPCVPLSTTGSPDILGLRFWLDASDIDADGNTANNPAAGQPVSLWRDKICGLEVEQDEPLSQPVMSTLGAMNAPAVRFVEDSDADGPLDLTDWLIDRDIAEANWTADTQGSMVAILSSRRAAQSFYFELARDNGGCDWVIDQPGCAPHESTLLPFIGEACGFGAQGIGEILGVSADTNIANCSQQGVPTDDSLLYSIWSGGTGTPWSYATNGLPPVVGARGGPHAAGDTWMANVIDPGYVTIGAGRTRSGAVPRGNFYDGHIAEILIYDHALDVTEVDEITLYVAGTYGLPLTPAPTGLTAVVDGGDIFLDWDDSPGLIDGYNVYRSLTSAGPYEKQNTVPLAVSEYLDDDVTVGVNYFYVVRVETDGVESDDSAEFRGRIRTVCDPLSTAGSPPVDGLRFWIDARDLDADGVNDGLALGTAVSLWRDKICGVELSAPAGQEPILSTLGDGMAVNFAPDLAPEDGGAVEPLGDFLFNDDVASDIFEDASGSFVLIATTRSSPEWTLVFEAGVPNMNEDPGDPPVIGFEFNNSGAEGLGINPQSENCYVHPQEPIDDGNFHVSIVSHDDAEPSFPAYYSFFQDGVELLEPIVFNCGGGPEGGRWFSSKMGPRQFMSMGGRSYGLEPDIQTRCCSYKGEIGEILIYDHPLDGAEIAAIEAYASSKYACDPDCPTKGEIFRRGDANPDGAVNLTDGIAIFNFLFLGGETPTCLEAADTNDTDDAINLTDGIYVLNFLFLGGDAPPEPGPFACGLEPAESEFTFGCDSYPAECN